MINNNMELQEMCKKYREYQRLIDEISCEMEAIKDDIKEYMGDKTTLIHGEYKIKNTEYTSTRLDTGKVKENFPEIYEQCSYTSKSRRFSIT